MRQIQLLGPVDKRVIAYPLFRMCDVMGKVLVITDDTNFRRFSEDYSNEFTVGRSDFYVCHDVNKAVIEELGVRLSSYDYVLFITTNTLIDGNDCLVYCHGQSQLILDEDMLFNLEEIEHFDVTISTSKAKDKESKFCSVDGKTLAYVWYCEENKMFMPCKSAGVVGLCATLFANIFGMSKEEFATTIGKEVQ